MSVTPAADFGNGYGQLFVKPASDPCHGRVIVEQADRMVYLPASWVDGPVADGLVPWAELARVQPWTMGATLKVHGVNRRVVYVITGGCGPAVYAYLCEQPD